MDIIKLPEYNIYIGHIQRALYHFIEEGNYAQRIVVVDENTQEHCLPIIAKFLGNFTFQTIVIPPGEQHKNIRTCEQIWSSLMKNNIGRNTLVINLGGGVIGDMGGFCAGTFKRGIDFVQVPTTLLSQVDASVGGKLGIDFENIKNSIGLFRNPGGRFYRSGFSQNTAQTGSSKRVCRNHHTLFSLPMAINGRQYYKLIVWTILTGLI